jgi:hypothetical protein
MHLVAVRVLVDTFCESVRKLIEMMPMEAVGVLDKYCTVRSMMKTVL